MFKSGELPKGQIRSTVFTEKHKIKEVNVEVYRLISVMVWEPQLFRIAGFQWQAPSVTTKIVIILPNIILGRILA